MEAWRWEDGVCRKGRRKEGMDEIELDEVVGRNESARKACGRRVSRGGIVFV